MDIRSFFSPGFKAKSSSSSDEKGKGSSKAKASASNQLASKRKKTSKKRALDSDSDEEPLPQKLRKTTSTKTVIVESDDEDLAIVKKSKNVKDSTPKKGDKRKWKNEEKVAKPKEVLKPTNADDFFGSTPVAQKTKTSLLSKARTQKDSSQTKASEGSTGKKKESQKIDDEFMEIIDDDDDDFEKSIQELESCDKSNKKEKQRTSLEKPKFINESPIPKKTGGGKKVNEKGPKKDEEREPLKKTSPMKPSPTKAKQVRSGGNKKEEESKKTPEKPKEASEEKKKQEATPVEKKKSFYAYKAREGPRNLGAKELPQGADNCLEGLSFVITGILESIEREQAVDLVKRHGGKVVSAVSKKTSYLVVGRDPGESKISKASNFGTKQLDEDKFFDLIRQMPGKVSKYEPPQEKKKNEPYKSPSTTITSESKYFKSDEKTHVESNTSLQQDHSKKADTREQSQSSQLSQSSQPSQSTQSSQDISQQKAETLLWVDKYKPKVMKNIVGQHGDKSNAKKLLNWLLKWADNNQGGAKPKGKGGFFAGKEDGSIFKCALLSGPPGVGKTTTATIVCQEAGYSFMEMNASDTRSKKTLQQYITEVLSNKTMDHSLSGKRETVTGRHALIMDEVDGMAGNEDRGGVQELIGLIKGTKIPIICMCNDRNHPKIRSLANYCFDLRFYKPRIEQIKGFAMSVSCKEGLRIPPPVMEQIIVGANQDIRQVLHNLQMWSSTKKSMTYDEAKNEAQKSHKNIKIGPFDITKRLFSASDSQNMSLQDKLSLFFEDYSFVPLFIQENYLLSNPLQARGSKRKVLDLMSSAADFIADSNLVEKKIREAQAWSLLPLQGFFSCVAAPDMMRGGLGQRINFPQWLGKNSSQGKHDRILQELKVHTRLSCLAGKSDLNMDYLWLMKKKLVEPLVSPGDDVNGSVREVIDFMNSYNLTREDFESITDIGKWESQSDVAASIPSKVKAAFTRTYNKDVHLAPYATGSVAKKRRVAVEEDIGEGGAAESGEESNNDDDDITKDSMIKLSKKKPGETVQSKGGRGRGKAAGRGRGKK
ncbi:replication factor C subunit 1-like [Rhopilema esculentum]|uniref:replication factor C subunit 1-like n=1 Tax=Rhopilema esculentum TaxID=499914 RepID=UPI0031E193CA